MSDFFWYHPWRLVGSQPHVDVRHEHLPDGAIGATHADIIWLDRRLSQAERRCTLTHELVHRARGETACQPPDVERDVEQAAARLLIPIQLLLDKLAWTEDLEKLAEECWVDLPTLRARLDACSQVERDMIRRLAESMERGA